MIVFRQGKVSFSIQKETQIGIYGPNGSGKSTLLKAVAGQFERGPFIGESLIEGFDVYGKNSSAQEKIKKILYLGSDFQTPFQISVREVFELAKAANPQSTENMMEIAERFDLMHLLQRFFGNLSDGEKQRVMIARGVLQAPSWLLLDETFSKIDLNYSHQVIEQLKQLKRKEKGLMVVSHDLNLLTEFCDELWFIKNGQIIVSGPTNDVLTEDHLKNLYPAQNIQIIKSNQGQKKIIY